MMTFASFLEIFTTLILCVVLTILSVMLAQLAHFYWKKRIKRKQRVLYNQKRQEFEFENNKQLLTRLKSEFKIVSEENKHLKIIHEAFRRELKIYSDLRSERISYSIKLESENFELNQKLSKAYEQIRLLETDILKLETSQEKYLEVFDTSNESITQAKGLSIEELAELPQIMKGTSQSSDLDATVIVAKTGTVLFEQMKEQIKESGQNIGSLIDRIDNRMDQSPHENENMETYFCNNTSFSIRDFLPDKTT